MQTRFYEILVKQHLFGYFVSGSGSNISQNKELEFGLSFGFWFMVV